MRYLSVIFSFLIISCSQVPEKEMKEKHIPKIFVSNYVLYYFIDQLSDGKVDIYYPIPENSDPAFWNPNEEELSVLQECDLIVLNGAGYESWIEGLSLPTSKILNTSKSFSNGFIKVEDGPKHSHGKKGKHSHGHTAFTTWLDFDLAIKQLESCKDALIDLLQENYEMENTYNTISTELIKLGKKQRELLEEMNQTVFLASHPIYQYFSRANNIEITSYHWEPEEMPSESEWSTFKSELETEKTYIMFWEDEPLPEVRQKLELLNIKIVVYRPASNPDAEEDFIDLMKANIAGLESILKIR